MVTFTTASTTKEIGESVLFQPALKTYPMCHSWIITAHVSQECHLKYFNRKLDKTHQTVSLTDQPAAPSQLSPLQVRTHHYQ